MHFDYKTQDTCSQMISFDIEGNIVKNVEFMGGCKAIPMLIDGWTVEEIEAKLSGITCGSRTTSCGDQLAKAVRAAYEDKKQHDKKKNEDISIYDIEVLDADGNMVSLERYRGKVLLINNSATKCGFTPQYDELQSIYERYQAAGLEILDFPCSQFGNQVPDTVEEIVRFCDATYGVTFPIFETIEVNGANASPLYSYLKSQKGFDGFNEEHEFTALLRNILPMIDPDYENNSDIKWNFTKFIIDREGNVVKRFEPTDDMLEVEDCIEKLLY